MELIQVGPWHSVAWCAYGLCVKILHGTDRAAFCGPPSGALAVLIERHDRFVVGDEAREQGSLVWAFGNCRVLQVRWVLVDRGSRILAAPAFLARVVAVVIPERLGWTVLSALRLPGSSAVAFLPAGAQGLWRKSAIHPARLETRTKKSNMCASQWALRNPKAK